MLEFLSWTLSASSIGCYWKKAIWRSYCVNFTFTKFYAKFYFYSPKSSKYCNSIKKIGEKIIFVWFNYEFNFLTKGKVLLLYKAIWRYRDENLTAGWIYQNRPRKPTASLYKKIASHNGIRCGNNQFSVYSVAFQGIKIAVQKTRINGSRPFYMAWNQSQRRNFWSSTGNW